MSSCMQVFNKSYWLLNVVPWNRLYRINKVSKCHRVLVLSSSILFSAPRALRSLIAVEPSTIETNTHSLEFEFSVPDATQEDRSLATLNFFSHWIKRSLISPASLQGLDEYLQRHPLAQDAGQSLLHHLKFIHQLLLVPDGSDDHQFRHFLPRDVGYVLVDHLHHYHLHLDDDEVPVLCVDD